MIKIISSKWCKATIAFVTALCFSFECFAVSSQIVNSFYSYAHYGQTAQMRQLMKMGYGIDVQDDNGVSAWCVAKKKDDEQALRVLRWMGADPKQKCPTCTGAGCVGWPVAGAVAGALVVGGGIAALAGGGGGGGSDPCSDKPNSHDENGTCVCNAGYIDQNDTCFKDLGCDSKIGSDGTQTQDQCNCKTGYNGTLCDSCDEGYLKQNGVCYLDLDCAKKVGSTGVQNANQCVCKAGYTGATCENCAQGYYKDNATGICYPDKGCVHGEQQGNTCKCEPGYVGDLCDGCADNYYRDEATGICYAEKDCGHGTQQGNTCKCEPGYAGANCKDCADNYYKDTATGICYPDKGCVHGKQQGNTCVCEPGYVGDLCDGCAENYYKDEATGICYPDRGCVHGKQDGNTCVCDPGYKGVTCAQCDTDYYMDSATGICYPDKGCVHGKQQGDTCVCEHEYAGELCNTCAEGYVMDDATGICYAERDCNNHGTQVGNTCECKDGYSGNYCESCAENYIRGTDGTTCYEKINCNHGVQKDDSCVCNPGYAGAYCDTCDEAKGYVKGDDGLCYPEKGCVHGTQVGNTCECEPGYAGAYCDTCDDGYKLGTDRTTCYKEINCGDHGKQVDDKCECADGWAGDKCDECDEANGYIPGTDGRCYKEKDCGEHGTQNGDTCDCEKGYTGDYCDACDEANGYIPGTDGSTCYKKIDCGEHGTQVNDYCDCSDGWTGDKCDTCNISAGYIEIDGSCYYDLKCSTHTPGATGVQEGDKCVCNDGYTGDTCEECDDDHVMGTGGVCFDKIDCGEHGRQVDDKCECNDGWTGDTCNTCDKANGYTEIDGSCYLDLKCSEHTPGATGVQEGNQCVCNEGYTGTTCDDCATGYGHHTPGDDKTCNKDLDCGNGTQNGDTCVCNDGYVLGSGPNFCTQCDTANDYGMNTEGVCVKKGTDITGRSQDNVNYNSGNISIDTARDQFKNEYADLYGLKYSYDEANPSSSAIDAKDSLYNGQSLPTSGGTFDQSNSITLVQRSDGNVYGLYSDNAVSIYNMYVKYEEAAASVDVKAKIDITQEGNGDAYGIWGTGNLYNAWMNNGEEPDDAYKVAGSIIITNNGTGSSYGMWTDSGNIDNNGHYNSTISVTNTSEEGGMVTAGVRSAGGDISNSGEITVSAASGTAYGILSEGTGTVDNSGTITVTGSDKSDLVIGIYSDGGEVTNSGTIDVSGASGKTYGIVAANGATVSNTGTIKVNGSSCTNCTTDENSPYIVLDDISTLSNAGLLVSEGDLNFDSFGGTVMLTKGGAFEAAGEIAGNLAVDAAGISAKTFDDRYVAENAFNADEVNVNLRSNSAMFTAEKEGNDVVMNRVSFNDLSADSSVAAFLERNYNSGNGLELFESLRRSPTGDTFSKAESQWLGYGLLPNFSRENMRFMQNLNSALNDKLFDTEENSSVRKMVGYDYFTQDRDSRGTLTGYDNYANSAYFMYDREVNADWRAGFGMSVTHFYSSYDDDSTRKEIMVQGLLPLFYDAGNGVKTASIFRAGYGNGEYKRHTHDGNFESDLSEWIYGVSNSARYEVDLGVVKLSPVAEFNILGYYQNRIREDKNKVGAISADAENNLSVEAGLGFRLNKDFELNEHNKISFKAGAMYYHEFANPYHSLTASQHGMEGTYRITDYEGIYDRDRGVLNAGVDYDWNEFTLYGNFNQYIEDESPFSVNLGLKYNF